LSSFLKYLTGKNILSCSEQVFRDYQTCDYDLSKLNFYNLLKFMNTFTNQHKYLLKNLTKSQDPLDQIKVI